MQTHCSLQVLQTPLVPNTDERRLKTELPNWCRIKKRNKQWHANVCACLDLVCLGHIAPALLVFPICVHICVCSFIFHFNYGEDNSSVCANSTQTNTLPPSVFWMVEFLYMRLLLCIMCVLHVSSPSLHCFFLLYFSSDHQGATESILGSVCLQNK